MIRKAALGETTRKHTAERNRLRRMLRQNVLHGFCFTNFAFFFYLLVSLAGKFACHSFLQLFSVNAVAFGGIHETSRQALKR
jgi:hypothetical protein